MTGQEKHTRLTLDEMVRRAEQVKESKNQNKTKELYVFLVLSFLYPPKMFNPVLSVQCLQGISIL